MNTMTRERIKYTHTLMIETFKANPVSFVWLMLSIALMGLLLRLLEDFRRLGIILTMLDDVYGRSRAGPSL
jgi:hypothetical protein